MRTKTRTSTDSKAYETKQTGSLNSLEKEGSLEVESKQGGSLNVEVKQGDSQEVESKQGGRL